MHDATIQASRSFLTLTIALMAFLVLLINVSFKIVALYGLMFSISSILCATITCLYWLVLKNCSQAQQRQILNQSLMALYFFSLGTYLLVTLPPADYMRDQTAYQIVFDAIPRKFFASTLAFGISFYIPHLLFCSKISSSLSLKKRSLLVICGGFCFFTIDFLLLFSDPLIKNFNFIYKDSLLIASGLVLVASGLYRVGLVFAKYLRGKSANKIDSYRLSPEYNYLISFTVIILLICLACEYRLVAFGNCTLVASGIFFPFMLMASNLAGELFGLKANLRLAAVLIITALFFDILLMLIVVLPAPDFFNLNPYYCFVIPRRISSASLTLLVSFVGNAWLLENLKHTEYGKHRALRMLIANLIVASLLCVVNYSLLFSGIYPYERIMSLAINGWIYKFMLTVICLPLILWLYNWLANHNQKADGYGSFANEAES